MVLIAELTGPHRLSPGLIDADRRGAVKRTSVPEKQTASGLKTIPREGSGVLPSPTRLKRTDSGRQGRSAERVPSWNELMICSGLHGCSCVAVSPWSNSGQIPFLFSWRQSVLHLNFTVSMNVITIQKRLHRMKQCTCLGQCDADMLIPYYINECPFRRGAGLLRPSLSRLSIVFTACPVSVTGIAIASE